MPLDTAQVLLTLRTPALIAWAKSQGVEGDLAGQNETVATVLNEVSQAPILRLYEQSRFAGSQVAVTWFRGVPPPESGEPLSGLSVAPLAARDLKAPFGLLWDHEIDGLGRAIRLAFNNGTRAIRDGLYFRPVEQYGFATLVWRKLGSGDRVLEVHADANRVAGLFETVLPGAGVDLTNATVLDLRNHVSELRSVLNATYIGAEKQVVVEGDPCKQVSWKAHDGQSVDADGSGMLRAGHDSYPSITDTLECKLAGRMAHLVVSRRLFSVKFTPMGVDVTGEVFEKAEGIGGWTQFDKDVRISAYAVPSRRGGGQPR